MTKVTSRYIAAAKRELRQCEDHPPSPNHITHIPRARTEIRATPGATTDSSRPLAGRGV